MSMNRKEFLKRLGFLGAGVFLTPAGGLGSVKSDEIFQPPVIEKATIEYEKIRLELFHPWTITRGTAQYKENVLVYYKRDGIIGIGEAGHMTAAGQNAERTISEVVRLIPFYEKVNPWEFYTISEQVRELLPDLSPAKAALDVALMDWIGKKLGMPLYQFFGLNPNKTVDTSFTIGVDTIEVMKQKVKEAEVYKIIKVKLAGKDNDRDVIQTIHAMTSKPIRVDMNQAWQNKEKAIIEVEWMAKQGVEMIEQPFPIPMIDETGWLKQRSPLPIVADESVETSHDIAKLAGAVHGVNIKLMKSGGLLEAYRMIILAQTLGMDVMLGCMIETSAATSAACQLQPLAKWVDLDGPLLIQNDPFQGLVFQDGHWILSRKPGLGITKKS